MELYFIPSLLKADQCAVPQYNLFLFFMAPFGRSVAKCLILLQACKK